MAYCYQIFGIMDRNTCGPHYPCFNVFWRQMRICSTRELAEQAVKEYVGICVNEKRLLRIAVRKVLIDSAVPYEEEWLYDRDGEPIAPKRFEAGDLVAVLEDDEVFLGYVARSCKEDESDEEYTILRDKGYVHHSNHPMWRVSGPTFKVSRQTEMHLRKMCEKVINRY